MIRRRIGRPGLLGAMARTAVVAGTATAVSNRVERRAADRDAQQQMVAEAQQQQYAAQAPAQPAPAPPAADDRIEQLSKLAELKAQGILTDAEFAAEKARILAG
ncbi:SHOCT domain-containing protein [Streptomyces sp. A7024]|uniref:SHOCT domain-containing protein n=1 Tax=Streptomyces coryli TaxID=1128680 RepID=A0A6G4UEG3_9ACTN|nr:SHOCT domain-containing protein [Streptomyces coryli]NGN69908.1 SHOCT domain-containing protein [Streptomyces coryli]